jgi:sugar phosphate permease
MKKIFYGWWVVAATFPISLYVSGIVYYGFTALFEPLIKEFGWSYTQVSLAASLRGMESGIFAPLVGLLVDRLGSRTLILSGTIITGLGLILLSFTRSLPMFYGSFLLLALGAGGCMALVSMSAVAHWFEKNAGKAFGVMSSAFGASGLMVPFIVWLIDAFNWRGAVIILGVGLWIFGVPLALVIRNKPEQSSPVVDELSSDGTAPRHENQGGNAKVGVKVSVKDALKNRSFVYLVVAETIRTTAVLAVVTHAMPISVT